MTGYLWRGRPDLAVLNAAIMAARGSSGKPVPRNKSSAAHGTEAGLMRHRRAGEKACQACREAHASAQARRREARAGV